MVTNYRSRDSLLCVVTRDGWSVRAPQEDGNLSISCLLNNMLLSLSVNLSFTHQS